MKKVCSLFVTILFCCMGFIGKPVQVSAQNWSDTLAMIDKVLSRYANNIPGAQLAISRNGVIIYSSARGMADLEHQVPLTKTSRIEPGSVSKQFTAASVLLLEQQGKLSLNDDIRKYVPEVPDYGHTITIRHIMNHVSGIKDWGSIAEIGGWPRGTRAYNNNDALHIISLQKTLNNIPNDEYIYSNSGYNLLAIIVKRVSGMELALFSKKYIFEPAGMTHTEWRDDYQRVVPERAIAYSKSGNTFITNMPNENVYGNGGLLTTAEDLLAWNRYYLGGKFGSPSLLPKQLLTTPFNNGKKHSYAAGLFVDSTNGWASISHSGATAGYRANLDYFPQLGLSIAWVSNNSQPEMSDIPAAVRNIFVKNLRPSESRNTIGGTIQIFKPYLGAYRDAKTDMGLLFFIENDSLFLYPHIKVIPAGGNSVTVGRSRIVFNNAKKAFYITGNDTTVYSAASPAAVTAQNIQEYAGLYASTETESKMNVVVKEGKLFMEQRNEFTLLTPFYKDGFNFPGGSIFFERNSEGKINKFFISIARARKVVFEKLN